MTLVDATEAFAELAECVDELKAKLDVKRPRDRTGAE
jgi:hypothetical protein